MSRSKSKKPKSPVDNVQVNNQNGTSVVVTEDSFDKASIEAQQRRHESIGYLFDKASTLLETILDDPSVEASAKLFPVRLAMDIYTTKEKFVREDERIDLEKRRLAIEEKKAGMSQIPPGSTFNQQNNFINLPSDGQPQKIDLNNLKKRQEELLSSFLPGPKNNEIPDN